VRGRSWPEDEGPRFWTFGLRGAKLQHNLRLLALAGLGVILLVVAPLFARGKEDRGQAVERVVQAAPPVETSLGRLEKEMAAEAAEVLSRIRGAGRVVVSVRLRSGPGVTCADNRTVSRRSTEERDTAGGTRTIAEENESVQVVMTRKVQEGEETPVVTRVERPEVDGVVVVAEGAANSTIKAELFRAAQVLLGVPAHRVTVLPMKAGE
jgi:stage III sporulation protein AG